MDELVEAQRNRIREAPKPRNMEYLNLLVSIIQPVLRFPSDEEQKRVFGEKLSTTLNFLVKHSNKLYGEYDISDIMQRKIETEEALQKLIKDVEGYLKCNEVEIHVTEVAINLLETFIKKNKKTVSFDKLKELHEEIMKAHDDKWIQQDHVTELWSDGEITSQKGRDLYGSRSVFTLEHPFKDNFEWTFACKGGNGKSYVILKSDSIARGFRDRMAEML